MKRNLVILSVFLLASVLVTVTAMGQSIVKTYASEWKKVDELNEKGLPKSALEQIKKIYLMAKNEKQDAQVIKSLLLMIEMKQQMGDRSPLQWKK